MGAELDIDDVAGQSPKAVKELASLREALERARLALADIAYSEDMTLELAQKKAKRIYLLTDPDKLLTARD